jgi:hypothetical protein
MASAACGDGKFKCEVVNEKPQPAQLHLSMKLRGPGFEVTDDSYVLA